MACFRLLHDDDDDDDMAPIPELARREVLQAAGCSNLPHWLLVGVLSTS